MLLSIVSFFVFHQYWHYKLPALGNGPRLAAMGLVLLAGMLGCLVPLVFFDLSRSGTVARAIIFIFLGLLLLGMNALYARFKARFAGPTAPDDDASNRLDEAEADDPSNPAEPDPQTVWP